VLGVDRSKRPGVATHTSIAVLDRTGLAPIERPALNNSAVRSHTNRAVHDLLVGLAGLEPAT
jgi:hypothetical protein